jgi:hypothetical protein
MADPNPNEDVETDVTEEVEVDIHGTPQAEHGTPQAEHGTPQTFERE